MRRNPKRYTFVGTEREEPDPRRHQEAIRTWTGYVVRRLAEPEPIKRPGGE